MRGAVVFVGSAHFPKGMPAGVSTLSELRDELAQGPHPDPAGAPAWTALQRIVRTDGSARREHLRALQARRAR